MTSLLWLLLATHTAVPLSTSMMPPRVEPAFVAFATEVEDSLRAGDPAMLDARVDLDRLLQRATRHLPASKELINELTGDAREDGLRVGERLLASGDESLRVRLLRVQMQAGAPRALFRILSQSGLNYFEFELGRNARGEVSIVDIYPYMSGEFLSQSLRRVYLMAAAEEGRRPGKRKRELLGNMPRLRRIQHLFEARQYREVVEELAQLPPALLEEKSFQIIRLNALSHLDEAEYQKALQAFEKAFPGDPMLELRSLENSLLRADPVATMRAIDRLDRRVKDPYLQYLRGTVKLEQEDREGAKRFFQAALRAEPTLVEPYVDLLALAIEESDYAGAVLLLDALEHETGAGVLNVSVEGEPGTEGFLKSEEYQTWRKRRSRRGVRSGRPGDDSL